MRYSQSWENSFCHIRRWHWRFRNLHQSIWPYVCSSLGWLKSMFSWHFALSNLWPAWEIDGVKSYPQQGSFDRQLSFWGDVNDAKELQEIYTLLTENYVEDDDPEGLPGCGQLWWTRVNFGGLYHPIWENFFLLQLPMLPTFPWSQIWLGKRRNRQQKNRTACSASTIRRTSWNGPWNRQGIWGRRSGVWSQEQLKWAQDVCNDGASPSTYYDGWPSSNQTWRVGFP